MDKVRKIPSIINNVARIIDSFNSKIICFLQSRFDELDKFAANIAICNAIGYLVSVGGPTIMDPLIEHSYAFGPRTYPLGWLIFLGAIPMSAISYKVNISNFKIVKKSVLTCLSVLLTWLTLLCFGPEYPHIWVLMVPVVFGLTTSTAVYIHNYKLNFEFLLFEHISECVKVEKLKLDYETWFRLFLAVLTGYAAIAITYLTKVPELVKILTPNEKEQFIMQAGFFLAISIASIVFLMTICLEMIRKTTNIKNKMICIVKHLRECP